MKKNSTHTGMTVKTGTTAGSYRQGRVVKKGH
jgi:hypothetical protein